MEQALLTKEATIDLLFDEIISQIDEYRGEMSRLEFVRLLIRNRLEKYNENHADEEEIFCFIKDVLEMLSVHLEFLCKIKSSNISTMPAYRYV